MGTPGAARATDRPIVIAGCARSGTTMLQMMLDRHPRIAVPSETRFPMGLHRRRVQLGDLERSPIDVDGKHVVIIGGGDTGADCLGTAHRQGAASVTTIPSPKSHVGVPIVLPLVRSVN